MLCPICLEPIDEEKGDLYRVTGCEHIYHKHCIFEWKKYSTKCPCCRGTLYDELGSTFSRMQNIPTEEAMPDITSEGILENVIYSPIGIIWPICIVSAFLLFETVCFCIFLSLIFIVALFVIYKGESYSTCYGIFLVIFL